MILYPKLQTFVQVADFGLARISSDTDTHVSTRVMGTFGYDSILDYLLNQDLVLYVTICLRFSLSEMLNSINAVT